MENEYTEYINEFSEKYPKLFYKKDGNLYSCFSNKLLEFDFMHGELIVNEKSLPEGYYYFTENGLENYYTELDHVDDKFYFILFEYNVKVHNNNPGQNIEKIYRLWQINQIIND